MTSHLSALAPDDLLALLRALTGIAGRPDDEGPFVHGPADPVVRAAFDRVSVFKPTPEPWRLALAEFLRKHPEAWELVGGGPGTPINAPARRVALMREIGNSVAERAEAVQDVAYATSGQAEQRGIIIVSGYVNRMVDEFCGAGFRLKPPRLHPKDPHPPQAFDEALSGADLVGIALSLDRGAQRSGSGPLREALDAGAKKLLTEGMARSAR
jgi:hypothetical protein